MSVYLDSVIVIYIVEGPPAFATRAQAHVAALRSAGHRFAASELVRLECKVKPLRVGDTALIGDFDRFLDDPVMNLVPFTTSVFDRATSIRALHNLKLGDSLHLAAAVESGCAAFLTNDDRLARFPDLAVEVLL
jgi:uncharacterized protein